MLAREVDFPFTPDIAGTVRVRLEATVPQPRRLPERTRPRSHIRRSAVLAIAAMLVLAAAVAAVVLGIGGIRFRFVEQISTPPSAASPSASARTATAGSAAATPGGTRLGASLALGRAVAAADVPPLIRFTPLAPPMLAGLGNPDAVYVSERPDGGMVSYVYGARPGYPETAPGSGIGLLITQFRADLRSEYFQKLLGRGTTLVQTRVNGRPGYFLSGELHSFLYQPTGDLEPGEESFRLVGNALLWTQSDLTLRMEGDLTLDEALAVAASIR